MSTRDLSNLARAILKSTLLKPVQTRKWLKPQTHTSARDSSVGAPWEIYRVTGFTRDERVIDLYTKNGAFGLYSSLFVLVPDYDVAFTILAAGPEVRSLTTLLTESTLSSFLPAVELITKRTAAVRYAGVYESVLSNSKINITVDEGPGLLISQWISRGKDVLKSFEESIENEGLRLDVRLYPTGLKTKAGDGSKTSFRVFQQNLPVETASRNRTSSQNNNLRFLSTCASWSGIDLRMYGLKADDHLVFNINRAGRAVEVELRALRTTLKKQAAA